MTIYLTYRKLKNITFTRVNNLLSENSIFLKN